MKTLLKLEYLSLLLVSLYIYSELHFAWWLFFACILLPDIGMLGYLVNTRVGAFTYNLFHHMGIAALFLLTGIIFFKNNEWLEFTGVILLAHSSLDRLLGYGLKYEDDFKNTHLGRIGKP
jgi:hypothetical protein